MSTEEATTLTHKVLPDGMYAEWRGLVLPAITTVKHQGAVELKWTRPGLPPGNFSLYERTGEYWAVIPESELTGLFDLSTFCTWNGQRCAVSDELPPGTLQLTWIGSGDPVEAKALGFFPHMEHGVFVTAVPKESVQNLHQVRRDIPILPDPTSGIVQS